MYIVEESGTHKNSANFIYLHQNLSTTELQNQLFRVIINIVWAC